MFGAGSEGGIICNNRRLSLYLNLKPVINQIMESILHIETISHLNKLLEQDDTVHPLISVVDYSKVKFSDTKSIKVSNEFYTIVLKDVWPGSLKYGRNYYDFQEGTLAFIAPNQVYTIENPDKSKDLNGWGLYFHPDLIKGTHLAKEMKEYNFFNYNIHEALHVSEQEKSRLTGIVKEIEFETKQNMDRHTNKLIVSSIDMLLNCCNRYYDRQFLTRSVKNKDIISEFESLILNYFNSEEVSENGYPSISYFAAKLNLSTNYFSDLLKKETGKNGTEHIQLHVIEIAKEKLLNSTETVSNIAYELGFEYPQYFSKMFKKRTGVTPAEYRA